MATELGVSKKTIYNAFDSKEDIFYFVISRKAEARRAMIEKEIEHLGSAMAKMEEMIRINFTEFRKIHQRKIKAFEDRFQTEIAAGAFRQAFYQMVSDIVSEGVENDEFEVCDHEMTVSYIQVLIAESFKMIREGNAVNPEAPLICTIKKILNKRT